jgi:hypothetical protein
MILAHRVVPWRAAKLGDLSQGEGWVKFRSEMSEDEGLFIVKVKV